MKTFMKKHPALADACDAVLSLLSGSFALLAIANLLLGEDPLQEHFTVPFNHLPDAGNFDDVGAQSNNHGGFNVRVESGASR